MSDIHDLMSDAICGDLDQVFEEGNTPADECRDQPCFVAEAVEMTVPCQGHEDIAQNQQSDGREGVLHRNFVVYWRDIGGFSAGRHAGPSAIPGFLAKTGNHD